jgi:menaquinone-9 beta-reductase
MEFMSQKTLQTDLFVVGGGPAGLAAAIAARQKGFSAIVADYAQPPIDKACGEGLMPDTISALFRLGVKLGIGHGVRFRGIRFADSQSSAAAEFPDGFGLGMRRPELHELLIRRAIETGVSLVWGTRSIRLTSGGIALDWRRIECCWIIGADGQNSRSRAWMGLEGRRYQRIRFGFRQHYSTV